MTSRLPQIFEDSFFPGFAVDPFSEGEIFHTPSVFGRHADRVMKTDVRETDHSFELAIDLPGFKKNEIEAELKDGYLTISAHKAVSQEEKSAEGRVIRSERTTGACSRSFFVGKEVKEGDCKASFEDGVLHVSVPKVTENAEPARRLISIG
jgi:HSP20 family protein